MTTNVNNPTVIISIKLTTSSYFMERQTPSQAATQKRKRAPRSCIQCRQRKVRCDLNSPCGPCMRSRTSLNCIYDEYTRSDEENRTTNPASINQSASPVTNGEASSLLSSRDAGKRTAIGGDSGATSQSQRSIEDLQIRIRNLEQIIAKNTTSRDDRISRINADSSLSSSEVRFDEQSIKVPTPRLRNFVNKTKIFGANNWLHTAAEFQVLGRFLSEDVPFLERFDDRTEFVSLLRECINFRVISHAHRLDDNTLPLVDLSSTFPPKPVCNELVQCYMRTFEPIYHILYAPSFWTEYELFWENPQAVPKHFVMQLALIFALGSAFHPIRNNPTHYDGLVQDWIYAAHWWLAGPSDAASFTIHGLQVGCLLILSCLTGPSRTPLWVSTGSMLQIAMMMGLHRDTTLFPSLAPFQKEMRNRLWATIIELSVQALLDSGIPFPLTLDEFDSRPPSNINDEDISPELKDQPQPKEDRILTDSSVQILLYNSINTRLEIARLLNDPQRTNLTFEMAMKLGNELRAACRETAAFFRSIRSTSEGHNNERLEFQRRFIDMYLHRYMVLLHRPFMIESRKNPRYYLSRKMCVESAMVIASHSEKLDPTSIENCDDLSRLVCVGSGSFKGALSMDVITILGLELVMQVEEENLTTSTPGMPRTATAVDPLSEMAKANRAPLIRYLECIKEQLEQIIISGRASLKRYIFLVGILALTRAIDYGLPIKQTIYEDITVCLKKARDWLNAQLVEPVPNIPGDMPDASTSFPMGDFDSNFSFDFSDLFMLPDLLEPDVTRDNQFSNNET